MKNKSFVLVAFLLLSAFVYAGCSNGVKSPVSSNTQPSQSDTSKGVDASVKINDSATQSIGSKASVSILPAQTSEVASSQELTSGVSKSLSSDDVISKVSAAIGNVKEGNSLTLDRTENKDGKDYFVVQYSENVVDNAKSGDAHSATIGWYYVEQKTGKVYLYDVAGDQLTLVK